MENDDVSQMNENVVDLSGEEVQAARRLTEAYAAIRKEMARAIVGQEAVL